MYKLLGKERESGWVSAFNYCSRKKWGGGGFISFKVTKGIHVCGRIIDSSQISRRIHLACSKHPLWRVIYYHKIGEGGCLGGQCGMIVKGLEGPRQSTVA